MLILRVKIKNSYKAAVYLRLSREDGDKLESDSIHNQRELINQFLESHSEISVAGEFVDDGYSGTTFERPGFTKMMGEIERGNIDCVVVKDLSRFGRNYIETGKYLDRIFPLWGIRFIAINDSYDNTNQNSDADDIIVPFKNLINDSYCRDISIKVRSQLDVKKKAGKFIGKFAPYGYVKDPKDKNHLIVDDYAAGIVRRIFDMKLSGYNEARIADSLNESGVLTPMLYKRSQGLNYKSGFHVTDEPKWISKLVTRILTNEVYIGNMVQGKRRRINYKVKGCCDVSPDEWIRVENTHEPLVSEEVFSAVQKLLLADTRTSPYKDTVDIFAGFVKCGNCGRSMTMKFIPKKNKNEVKIYHYYHCMEAATRGNCDSARLINVDKLYNAVLAAVQSQVSQFIQASEFLSQLKVQPIRPVASKQMDDQIEAVNAELERYSDMRIHLYQDKMEGVISEEEYLALSSRFDQKINNAQQIIHNLNQKKESLKIDIIQTQPWIETMKKYGTIDKLTRKMVVFLIDEIVVYSKNSIEVRFNYMDEMQAIIATAEEAEADAEEAPLTERGA